MANVLLHASAESALPVGLVNVAQLQAGWRTLAMPCILACLALDDKASRVIVKRRDTPVAFVLTLVSIRMAVERGFGCESNEEKQESKSKLSRFYSYCSPAPRQYRGVRRPLRPPGARVPVAPGVRISPDIRPRRPQGRAPCTGYPADRQRIDTAQRRPIPTTSRI